MASGAADLKRYLAVSIGPLVVLALISINLATGPTGPQVVSPAYASYWSGKPLRINYARKMKPEEVDALIRQWGDFPATYQAIRETYPAEYERLLDHSAHDLRDDRFGTREEILERGQAVVRIGKLNSLIAAPAPALAALAQAYAKLVRDLKAEDVSECASLGSYGSPPPGAAGRGRAVKADLDMIGSLELRAVKAADTGGAMRRGILNSNDRSAWNAAMNASYAKASELWAGSAFDSASVAEQCDATVALFVGAAELPEESSANVMAHILQPDESGMPSRLRDLRDLGRSNGGSL
jgi:hypothetical protein